MQADTLARHAMSLSTSFHADICPYEVAVPTAAARPDACLRSVGSTRQQTIWAALVAPPVGTWGVRLVSPCLVRLQLQYLYVGDKQGERNARVPVPRASSHVAHESVRCRSSSALQEGVLNVVMGCNDGLLSDEHAICTAASCTTNCLAPVVKVTYAQHHPHACL